MTGTPSPEEASAGPVRPEDAQAAACKEAPALDFERGGGRVTVVTRDVHTGALLMVAHADAEALAETLRTGFLHYTSRRRGLWKKGATSGNVQRVVRLSTDCDADTLLVDVECAGPACHTGRRSCFGEAGLQGDAFSRLDAVVSARAAAPSLAPGYTRRLLLDRNLRLKKLGEEVSELVVACADGERLRAVEEAADVVYHLTVSLRALGASLHDVGRTLNARAQAAAREAEEGPP